MSSSKPAPDQLIQTYFLAKDNNRPHLMERAFAKNAELTITVNTDAIAFPSTIHGLSGISDTLVRKFGITYENIYSFCLQRPEAGMDACHFSCDWLVGMSDKEHHNARVGCGRYDWTFQSAAPGLIERLHITIATMAVLPATERQTVLEWISGLPYPWCGADAIVDTAPAIPALEPVLHYITRVM
jgi:hypothetical protein